MAGKQGGGRAGGTFTSDFSAMSTGRTQTSALLGGGALDILSEEKRLIEKVFAIVDKDNSGSIDTKELEDMFKLFGVETTFLSAAIQRIMSNVDKDHDGTISPQEFYKLLSQKFEKGDPMREVRDNFGRIDNKKDGKLDTEELFHVAQDLGETLKKEDIRHMIHIFKELCEEVNAKAAGRKKQPVQMDERATLSLDEWYTVMQQEL